MVLTIAGQTYAGAVTLGAATTLARRHGGVLVDLDAAGGPVSLAITGGASSAPRSAACRRVALHVDKATRDWDWPYRHPGGGQLWRRGDAVRDTNLSDGRRAYCLHAHVGGAHGLE